MWNCVVAQVNDEARCPRITAAQRLSGRQEDGRERQGDRLPRGLREGGGNPGHGQRFDVPRPEGRLRRLAGAGHTLLARARRPRLSDLCAFPDAIAATRRSHRCHYEGRTATNYPSGKTFDSSYARGQPTTFAPRQVIAAWTEAMQKMKVGSKWELVCPPEIAYGGRAMGSDIPANSVLVFTMEMLSCQGVSAEL